MIAISQYGLILLMTLFLVFHILIITKVIPYQFVWGGRLKSDQQMIRFETFSILINLVFVVIILIQADFISVAVPKIVMTNLLWAMTALFLLNTLGNIVSKNKFEKMVFTPVTILLATFSMILALYN